MDKNKNIQSLKNKEKLITQWKQLRGVFFSVLDEDTKKFEKQYSTHFLYDSVAKHLNKSFRDINQIAESEINKYVSEI